MKNFIIFTILMVFSFGCSVSVSEDVAITKQKVMVKKVELVGGIVNPSLIKVTYDDGVVFLRFNGDRNIPVGVPCTMVSIKNFSGMYIYFVKDKDDEFEK